MKLIYSIFLILFCVKSFAIDWDSAVNKDMSTEEAKKYNAILGKFTAKNLNDAREGCIFSRNPPEFIFYVQILDNGLIGEKSYSDLSPEAVCITRNFGKMKWPTPPFSPYHFKITMFHLR